VTPNPFVHLFKSPVESLTAAAYALVLVAVLVATWWAGGRNALFLYQEWREGWYLLVPLRYCARAVAMVLVVALDLLLLAGIIGVLT
jgi:hypothetical protein